MVLGDGIKKNFKSLCSSSFYSGNVATPREGNYHAYVEISSFLFIICVTFNKQLFHPR